MSKKIERVAVLGLGKVGTLAAVLLHETGLEVTGFDMHAPQDQLPFPVEQKSAAIES